MGLLILAIIFFLIYPVTTASCPVPIFKGLFMLLPPIVLSRRLLLFSLNLELVWVESPTELLAFLFCWLRWRPIARRLEHFLLHHLSLHLRNYLFRCLNIPRLYRLTKPLRLFIPFTSHFHLSTCQAAHFLEIKSACDGF